MKNKKRSATKSKVVKNQTKPKYVDGFVLSVAKNKLSAYKNLARKASKIWLEYGALEYRESIGDDLDIKQGIPFPTLAKTKTDEVVIFAWIVYKSKSHRDQVNKKVMSDKRFDMDPSKMPFDCSNMTYGGFKIIVSA